MPLIIATAIRYLIMAAVQLGLWSLIEKYGIPLLEKAIVAIMEFFGVPEETAKDIMANEVVKGFEQVGIFAATLKTKLPIKAAELLGFTSKGFAKRKLSQAVEAKVAKAATVSVATEVATVGEAAKVAEAVAKGRGLSVSVVGSLFSSFINTIGKISIPLILAANVMDFGNWQGAYQKTFQKIFTSLGFPPDSPMPKAGTLSPDVWKRIYSTIEVLNPIGISFPFSNVDKPYSRANLAAMIDEVSANIVKNGGKADYKTVIGIALPLVQLQGQPDISKLDTLNFGSSSSTTSSGTSQASSTTTPKVFTGVVSQGVVGQGLVFEARPDDMIESVDELKQAAANNLTAYLNTLLGKIVYEVKIVASVVTKDGFKQTGTTQQIRSGTDSLGKAKYKTVTNKFATIVVYALTDKGTRAKLTTIVLGPTNSAKLTVAQSDLSKLETQLPSLVTTTDINDIKGIQTAAPITVSTPPQVQTPAPVVQAPIEKTVIVDKNVLSFALSQKQEGEKIGINGEEYRKKNGEMYRISDNAKAVAGIGVYIKDTGETSDTTTTTINTQGLYQVEKSNTVEGYEVIYYPAGQTPNANLRYSGAPTPSTSMPTWRPPTTTNSGASATTLSEWYASQGQSLPSISARAQFYENLGLGVAAFYTGTAEQNTKLLNALKSR